MAWNCHLQLAVRISDHELQRRPTGEIARPVAVDLVGVGEEVVGLGRPSQLRLVQRQGVAGRGAVEDGDVRGGRLEDAAKVSVSHHLVHVLDEFVQIRIVRIGVRVVEVAAHQHHQMIGAEVGGLAIYVGDELLQIRVQVEALQQRVVLYSSCACC